MIHDGVITGPLVFIITLISTCSGVEDLECSTSRSLSHSKHYFTQHRGLSLTDNLTLAAHYFLKQSKNHRKRQCWCNAYLFLRQTCVFKNIVSLSDAVKQGSKPHFLFLFFYSCKILSKIRTIWCPFDKDNFLIKKEKNNATYLASYDSLLLQYIIIPKRLSM